MIQADGLSLIRGGHHLLRDAQFTIFPGHSVGLVGANGAGKSSLFALFRGELKEDQGQLKIPSRWRIASVAQETPALETPALDYVIEGDTEYTQVQRDLDAAERANDGVAIARAHAQLDTIGGYHIQARAAQLLIGLGFTQNQLQQPVRSFSGGWRMRLNLAQALIARADLLLLDEPTNHLDLDAIVWLEGWLRKFAGTTIVISHDREFLDGVVQQIIHIERLQTQQYSGDYTSFQRQRSERYSQQEQQFKKEQARRAHLQKFVDRFRAKASKAKQAQSRLKALEKLTSTAPLGNDEPYDLSFPEPSKLPSPLLQLDDIQAGYGDVRILERVHLNLVPGSRIGLLGRNGAGKSTLMKVLAGVLSPQRGERAENAGLAIGYFAQHQLETLVLSEHAIAHLQKLDPKASEQSLRNFLGRFGFSGDRAYEAIAPFSGGEKARLVLALLIYQRPNLLLLDEPTNHLDLDMREALVLALQEFSGAMVIVSHDRHFLRATVDDYYLVAHSEVMAFQGDLDAYSTWLQDQLKQNADAPERNQSTEAAAQSRKIQRQSAAQQRQMLKPLRDQLKKTEAELEQITAQLQIVEQALAEPTMYQKENKDNLTVLLKQQGELRGLLATVEATWLELSDRLEQI